jgi:hypothetical protein
LRKQNAAGSRVRRRFFIPAARLPQEPRDWPPPETAAFSILEVRLPQEPRDWPPPERGG